MSDPYGYHANAMENFWASRDFQQQRQSLHNVRFVQPTQVVVQTRPSHSTIYIDHEGNVVQVNRVPQQVVMMNVPRNIQFRNF